MKLLGKEFKDKLTETIAKIEDNSGVEVVVAIGKKSGNYFFVPLITGIIFSFIALTYTIFAEEEFDDLMIYLYSVVLFCSGFLLFSIPLLSRILVPKDILKRNVEIYARALFQKGKIYETVSRQGILVYVSVFENEVFVQEDMGVFKRIPYDKILEIKNNFKSVFSIFPNGKAGSNLIIALEGIIPICKQFIPKEENDINEIPDDLEIQL
jgi:putative membrane protein